MNYFFSSALLAVIFSCSISHAQQTVRTWTSANGEHTFEAELQSVSDGTALLKGKNGKVKKVPLTSLSADDRTYAADFANDSGPTPSTKPSSQQRDRLKELGLKFSRGEFSLMSEKELKSKISDLLKEKKNIILMTRQLGEIMDKKLLGENRLVSLRQASLQLNSQFANATTVKENNRLVGMIEANNAQSDLLRTDIEALKKRINQAQGLINGARESFIQEVLNVRKYSDSLDETMEALGGDERFQVVRKDIESKMNIETKPLGETKSLAKLRKSLAKLEDGVLSDTIPLRDDGSGTFNATVTINGQPPIELVVDSGASLICLPQKVADGLGIVVSSNARDIVMTIADGSQIPGKLITLDSVRLGKFSANNIECVVLGRKASNAPSLLGMSFLGKFKFELDAAKSELKMVTLKSK